MSFILIFFAFSLFLFLIYLFLLFFYVFDKTTFIRAIIPIKKNKSSEFQFHSNKNESSLPVCRCRVPPFFPPIPHRTKFHPILEHNHRRESRSIQQSRGEAGAVTATRQLRNRQFEKPFAIVGINVGSSNAAKCAESIDHGSSRIATHHR